eukprot:5391135-Amphidinium_carterae.1
MVMYSLGQLLSIISSYDPMIEVHRRLALRSTIAVVNRGLEAQSIPLTTLVAAHSVETCLPRYFPSDHCIRFEPRQPGTIILPNKNP